MDVFFKQIGHRQWECVFDDKVFSAEDAPALLNKLEQYQTSWTHFFEDFRWMI